MSTIETGGGDARRTPRFLDGGGELGALMRRFDWAATPLGEPEAWPSELGVMVGVLLASSQPMFLAWGPQLRWLYNDSYATILQARHPLALGKPAVEVWPDVYDSLVPMFDTVLAGGAVHMEDILLNMRRRGVTEETHFSFSYTPVRVAGGEVTGIFCVCSETTSKVEADRRAGLAAAALADSETRYRALFESMGEGFCVIESVRLPGKPNDFRFLATNPAFVRSTGNREVVGKTIRDTFPSEPDEWFDIYDRVADTGEPARFQRGLLSAGTVLDIYAYRLDDGDRGDGGRRVGIVFMDVTARQRAQNERDRIADQLSLLNADLERQVADRGRERAALWRITSDLIGVLDGEGVFESSNPAWQAVLGWSADELVKTPIFDLIHPDDLEPSRRNFSKLLLGESTRNFINRFRGADGAYRWLSWLAVPEAGKYYCSGRDVTVEREAQSALAQAQEALRQAQKMEAVGQLTGGIAHDFNNLLAGISASLEILERRIGQRRFEGSERYIAAARGSARRAAALTQRLLAFSRRQTLDPRPVDLNRLVAGMEELIRRSVGPGVELEVVGAGGLWTTKADTSQLESALLNLCINARDAMAPNGGRLTVETANKWLDDRAAREQDLAPGQYVSLCVSDTGVGMPPEVVARAFDPFFTTKPIGEGTGLGLSMVYGFVRQSGGQVKIYSEVGRGTTMRLYFPRHLGPADVDAAPPVESAHSGDGETVLVVEDEATIREFIIEELREGGYHALEAPDGSSALRILQSNVRVDLLVTDVGLPGGMNGRQLADAGRVTRTALKVLFITGFADNAAVGNGHLDPGMEVLTKPFDMSAFGSKIRDMLDR